MGKSEIELREFLGRRDPATGRVTQRPERWATGAVIRKGLKINTTVNLAGGYFYALPNGVGRVAPEHDAALRAYVASLITPATEVQEVPTVESEAAPTPEPKKSGSK